jgi:enamine deaminase RidA (YjgF/YER057c/UK114 family)
MAFSFPASLLGIVVAVFGAFAFPAPASAQVERIPSSGGEVIIPGPPFAPAYYEFGYAPARRVGDTLYVSGVIIFRAEGEGNDAAAFEAQVRRGFRTLEMILKAAGASFANVAMVNSYHVWDGPNFTGAPMEQWDVIKRVRSEFIGEPHSAWTAVGTTGLLVPNGIVEIELVAHLGKD